MAAISGRDGGRMKLWQALQDKSRNRRAREGARWVTEAPAEAEEICSALFDELRMLFARQPPPAIDHALVSSLFASVSHLMVNREGGKELLLPLLHVACEHAGLEHDQMRALHDEFCYVADPSRAKRRWGALNLARQARSLSAGAQREGPSGEPSTSVARRPAGIAGIAFQAKMAKSRSRMDLAMGDSSATGSNLASAPVAEHAEAAAAAEEAASRRAAPARPTVIDPGMVVAARRGQAAFHKAYRTPNTEIQRARNTKPPARARPWSAAYAHGNTNKAIDFDNEVYGVD